MVLAKVKTNKNDVIYVNPRYIISVRKLFNGYHVSLTDFGFDISEAEFGRLINNCAALVEDEENDY